MLRIPPFRRARLVAVLAWWAAQVCAAAGDPAAAEVLPGTQPLATPSDLAAEMVAGIDRYLTRALAGIPEMRAARWKPDLSSPAAYQHWLEPRRDRLRRLIGAVDARMPVTALEFVSTTTAPALVGTGRGYAVHAVRWPVLEGVQGEGLLLEPRRPPVASVVALPDADWTPEQLAGLTPGVLPESQFARRLAELGCRVIVPLLIDRADTWSGNPAVRMTNQPHREFVYRAAFEMGRHIIGYEVQKVLAAVDWFARTGETRIPPPIGVIGYGEGGLLALYSTALDSRIDAVLVSGYFQPREGLWREPIYRNVWSLLPDFGDAELLAMVAPRAAIVEASRHPSVPGPPSPRPGRTGAAPGAIATPPLEAVRAEFERGRGLLRGTRLADHLQLIETLGGDGLPGSAGAMEALRRALGIDRGRGGEEEGGKGFPKEGVREGIRAPAADPADPSLALRAGSRPGGVSGAGSASLGSERLRRQFEQLNEHTQRIVRGSAARRRTFWAKADRSSAQRWIESSAWYRQYLWDEIIGRLPSPTLPPSPRTRLIEQQPKWRGYEVVLDVYPDVFAAGILLLPRDIPAGERRPVVVCQHGLEGRPADTIARDGEGFRYYQAFAARLAEEGFVVYAPQNPYIGGDAFRQLQRQANPLGLTLFSFIVRQHERTLQWLTELPFVDATRIGFYGLSYGGKTALRVPALLPGYAAVVCSGDFNEWVLKITSTSEPYSYLFTGEYEMSAFDEGNTFNHAELAGLIAPRPFMVERGHHDGVAPDEWVATEYATVRRLYATLGIPERTGIAFFNGPHRIDGVEAFAFLRRHLCWHAPETRPGGGP